MKAARMSRLKTTAIVASLWLMPGFLLGCHAGGKLTASTAPSEPLAIVPVPTIAPPSSTPHYSNAAAITISGLCMKGYTVYISADAINQTSCNGSSYSFSVAKADDGVYSFFINQKNETNVS